MWHLRSAQCAGNIGVEHSRRYANPDSSLIALGDWPGKHSEVVRQTETPKDGRARHEEREIERLWSRQNCHVRVEDNSLVLSPLEANPRPASADALAARITERLPRVQLSDLLIEVDGGTRFADHFVHAAGADTLRRLCYPISMPVSWPMPATSA